MNKQKIRIKAIENGLIDLYTREIQSWTEELALRQDELKDVLSRKNDTRTMNEHCKYLDEVTVVRVAALYASEMLEANQRLLNEANQF